jgi:hypothetical protein
MKAWGMWLPNGTRRDTDIEIPDIIITNPDYVYKVDTDDGKSRLAGLKEIEITGLILDLSPDSAEYDENGNIINI